MLTKIADRIDAEHENAMSSAEQLLANAGQLLADVEKDRDHNYANWQECKQKVLQGNITIDELYARIEHLEDELLHCTKPLKDADDVPIHLGDMMHGTCPSGKYVRGEVSAIGDNKFWLSNVEFSLRPDYMRHYHKPTVEEMLWELLGKITPSMEDKEAVPIVKAYAEKLQLADDGKEQ